MRLTGKAEKKATEKLFKFDPFLSANIRSFRKPAERKRLFPGISFNIVSICGAALKLCFGMLSFRMPTEVHLECEIPKKLPSARIKIRVDNCRKTFDWSSEKFHRQDSLHLIGFRSGIENVSCPNPSIHLGTQNLPHLISRKFPFKTVCDSPKSGV